MNTTRYSENIKIVSLVSPDYVGSKNLIRTLCRQIDKLIDTHGLLHCKAQSICFNEFCLEQHYQEYDAHAVCKHDCETSKSAHGHHGISQQ